MPFCFSLYVFGPQMEIKKILNWTVADNPPNLSALNFFVDAIYISHPQIYTLRYIFAVFISWRYDFMLHSAEGTVFQQLQSLGPLLHLCCARSYPGCRTMHCVMPSYTIIHCLVGTHCECSNDWCGTANRPLPYSLIGRAQWRTVWSYTSSPAH
jgi:hypothetical protein